MKTIKKLFPNVKVHDVDEYFALSKNQREKWGIYLMPYALPAEFIDPNVKGWAKWSKQIRIEYPIQGWIREWFLSLDNPIYHFIRMRIMKFQDIKFAIKNFFNPGGKRWRKSWPRHKWIDISEVIRESNFALIQDFWHDEVNKNRIEWDSDTGHAEFYKWIKNAIAYIEIERKILEERIQAEYDKVDRKKSYEENYGELQRIEKQIEDSDTYHLNEMVKYRRFFWT